jgi:hypothetical protein
MTIMSSVVVKVFSMADNQELPALSQVVVPPSWYSPDGSGGLITGDTYDQVAPLRLRIDGVPVGQMRFEVTAMSGSGGGGSVIGRGSTIADIGPLGSNLTVTPVTVTVLPAGDIVGNPDLVIPGVGNVPSDQNPAPRSRAWSGEPIARRLWADWQNRRRRPSYDDE